MADLPAGTVTFLLTDIEGSTRLWEQHPEAMKIAVARQDALAASIIAAHAGVLVKSRGEGDSLFAVFSRASDALAAAAALQKALLAEEWPTPSPLRVRMALHTGEADLREGDYYGAAVNRCARLRAAAHGGQVLLSGATQQLLHHRLPRGVRLKDLGLHRLRDLAQPEQIYQLQHPDLPPVDAPLRSLQAFSHNLPVQLTSFVGREREMAEVKRLLSTTRLLTLTGAGGTGKTRLLLQVAAELLEEYEDGVWLVELATLSDPALVPQAAAAVLGLKEEPGKPLPQSLVEYLKPRQLLLLLDNCEHLLAASAALADAILRNCPRVRILTTSREGLGIVGERIYRVPSLSVPDARKLPPLEQLTQFEAVKLFAERAILGDPTFMITKQNAPAVVEVCQRLDGIPLAIELAAARVKALPVEKLNERLAGALLIGSSRAALPRQQTLRALIDWSYDLLSEPERALLRRLSVFAGGWTLEAAEAVVSGQWSVVSEPASLLRASSGHAVSLLPSDVLDLLTALVEKSLVLYEEREGQARYRLLETVRQYGRDRLQESGEVQVVRQRHRDCFLRLAEEAAPKLHGPDQRNWVDRLEGEHDNLRAALEWCQAQNDGGEAWLRMTVALSTFWWHSGYRSEGRAWLERALAAGETASAELRGKALVEAGNMALAQGDLVGAAALLEQGLAVYRQAGDKQGIAWALIGLGHLARHKGDYERDRRLTEEALALTREVDDQWMMAIALWNLGNNAQHTGDYERAEGLFRESLALRQAQGDEQGVAHTLHHLGGLARLRGDYVAARSFHEQSLAIYRREGYKGGIAHSLNSLAKIARLSGDYELGRSLHRESLSLLWELNDKVAITYCLLGLADVAWLQGQARRGAALLAAADALRQAIGLSPNADAVVTYESNLLALRSILGEEAFAAAWAEGQAMTLEQAIAYALEVDAAAGEQE
jgi:predicted ATPase/class 3 adenylate cyclase